MRKSKRESLPHGFFTDLLWEPASDWSCIYRHQIWVQLVEGGSAGLVRDESGKMSANLILPFLSILDAQPPPYLPPCPHSLWVQPWKFNLYHFSLRFCPSPDCAAHRGIASSKKGSVSQRIKLSSANCSKWHWKSRYSACVSMLLNEFRNYTALPWKPPEAPISPRN